MISTDRIALWDRHFGSQGPARTADDLWRVVQRLDEVEDGLHWILRCLAGGPEESIELDLRVAIQVVQESFEELRTTVRSIREAVPEQAS